MRKVSVVWLALLGILTVLAGWISVGLWTTVLQTMVDLCLLSLLGGLMLLYNLLRRHQARKFFARFFGGGDATMMAVITPLFSPTGYVRFLLAACFIALVWWSIRRPATIPLAGFLALTLIGYIFIIIACVWI